jgi:hypothetical protein
MATSAALALAVLAAGAGCAFKGTVQVGEEQIEAVFEDSWLVGGTAREIFGDYRFWVEQNGEFLRPPQWDQENPEDGFRGKNGQYKLAGILRMDEGCCARLVDGLFDLDERGILKSGERKSDETERITRLSKEYGWLAVGNDGREVLVVPRAVTDAAREGLAIWRRHPGARESLEELLRAMGEGNPSYLPEAPLDMMFLYGFGEDYEEEIRKDYGGWREGEDRRGPTCSREQFLSEWSKYDWRVGPLCTVGEFQGRLTVCVVATRREKQYSWESPFGWFFIFDGGRWKMFYFKGIGGAEC